MNFSIIIDEHYVLCCMNRPLPLLSDHRKCGGRLENVVDSLRDFFFG